jgi:ElaB/YqjD/DUF883 family membrane-anchored ribosome-binding protein
MAKDKGREFVDDARDRAEEMFEDAHVAIEDGLDEAHRYLKRQWRERPITVAAAAVGVGLVLGLLLGSRR